MLEAYTTPDEPFARASSSTRRVPTTMASAVSTGCSAKNREAVGQAACTM